MYRKQKLNAQELLQIHSVCNEFEKQWKSNQPLTIEALIERNPSLDRAALLESLIRSEMELRASSSTPLSLSECTRRFLDDSEAVGRAFSPVNDSMDLEFEDAATNHSDKSVATRLGEQISSASKQNVPSELGEYEIVNEYARGGMGIIYRARHKQLDRIVALKVVLGGQWATDLELARFQTEAKAIAALEHPHIVSLFEVGESGGYHYFSMPMIEGENLADAIQDGPLPSREAAEITRQIATAVEYAHQHGIIHRDLKPRNILLDKHHKASVSDFGLAKIVREDASLEASLTGNVVGTPAYMAPEQAAGTPSRASDIYSIGAILYTILTGRPPFQASTPWETLRQVQTYEPVAPRQLNALIDRDLETIAMKCLNKNPEARYSSAGNLTADLDRYLAGKPILARPVSGLEHFVRWTRRQPIVAGLAAAVFASLVGGIAVSLWFYAIARHNEQTALANFEFATATVKKYLSDVASSPELKEKGLEPLRQKLLSTAQEFYLKLESSPIRNLNIEERLADSQLGLAMISNELGDLENAQKHYDQAQKAYELLTHRDAQNVDYTRKLIQSLRGQAIILSKQNMTSDAEAQFSKAIDESRRLYSTTQEKTDQLQLLSTLGELGSLYLNSSQISNQKSVFEEVERMCDQMRPTMAEVSFPADAELLIGTLDRLALSQQALGRFADSEQWFLTIVDVAKSQLKQDEKNPFFQSSVARASKNLMMVCSRSERLEDAKKHYDQSIAIYEELIREHPLVIEYMDGCALTQLNFGSIETARRNYSSAAAALRAAIGLQESIISRQPNNFDFRLGMGVFCSGLGNVLTKMDDFDGAEEALRRGSESLTEAQRIQPNSTNSLFLSGLISNNLGALYRDQRRFHEAKNAFQKSCDSSAKLIELVPENVSNVRLCAANFSNLAAICTQLKEAEQGIAAVAESNRLLQSLLAQNPGNSDYSNIMVNNGNTLAEFHLDANRLDDSEKSALESREIVTKLISNADSGDRFQTMLGAANFVLGRVAMRRGQFDLAFDYFEKTLAAYMVECKARERDGLQASRRVRELTVQAYCEKARALRMLGRHAEALAECKLGMGLTQGIDPVGLQSLMNRIQIEQHNDTWSQDELDKLRLKDDTPGSFDSLVDLAACYAMLSEKAVGNLKLVQESAMKDFLRRASKLDPIRFATLKEDNSFQQVSDWAPLTSP